MLLIHNTNQRNILISGARPTMAATTLNNAQPVINTNNATSPANGAPQRIMSALFGSLNRFISRLDAAPQEQQQSGVGGAYGFQVLRNANQEVSLEPWFDFIIGINGRTIVSTKEMDFKAEVTDGRCRTTLIRGSLQLRCATARATPSVWVFLARR